MTNIPRFRKRRRDAVEDYARRVFTKPGSDAETLLRRLDSFDDGHWRAVFDTSYFTVAAEQSEPSKSQWNTLKKRMKRMDVSVFIYKEHGTADCTDDGNSGCGYVDFGFFEK